MNERINELFGQALDQAVPETWSKLSPEQLSKLKENFAELIVRECISILDEDDGSTHHAELLEKHFGVEE